MEIKVIPFEELDKFLGIELVSVTGHKCEYQRIKDGRLVCYTTNDSGWHTSKHRYGFGWHVSQYDYTVYNFTNVYYPHKYEPNTLELETPEYITSAGKCPSYNVSECVRGSRKLSNFAPIL